jgi:hypothetical protein
MVAGFSTMEKAIPQWINICMKRASSSAFPDLDRVSTLKAVGTLEAMRDEPRAELGVGASRAMALEICKSKLTHEYAMEFSRGGIRVN